MINLKLKITRGISGNIFEIKKIVEEDETKTENISKCVINDREYSVGQFIIEENLYRLKMPGIMLTYT